MGAAAWTSVQAQLIDVNFTDDSYGLAGWGGNGVNGAAQSGAAVLGSAGDTWNAVGGLGAGPLVFAYAGSPAFLASYTSGPLVDSTGAVTPVTLSLIASQTYSATQPGWGNSSPFVTAGSPYANLFNTMLVATTANPQQTVTLNGLAPNQAYQLITYNGSDQNEAGARPSLFTVNGVTQTSTYDGVQSTLINGVDYLVFNAMSDGTGTLVINYGVSGAFETDFNGFQLQAVPEPGTLALLASGAVLLLGVQRRRNS
jgi:hypothetical protein